RRISETFADFPSSSLPLIETLLALNGKTNAVDGVGQVRVRERGYAIPAPEANAEIQTNLGRLRVMTHADGKSKSEKFPPPHEDGAVGYLARSYKGWRSGEGVKNVLDPCEDDNEGIQNDMSDDSMQNNEYYDTDSEVDHSQGNHYIVAPIGD
ncbi:putative serine threonine-protein kinase, partial [Trifolium pratense]